MNPESFRWLLYKEFFFLLARNIFPVESKRKNPPSDDSDDDDDAPLVKKTKREPSDAEVREVVAEILKDADLEQVTMKTVCKQVFH